jgi:hypothetical protein
MVTRTAHKDGYGILERHFPSVLHLRHLRATSDEGTHADSGIVVNPVKVKLTPDKTPSLESNPPKATRIRLRFLVRDKACGLSPCPFPERRFTVKCGWRRAERLPDNNLRKWSKAECHSARLSQDSAAQTLEGTDAQ